MSKLKDVFFKKDFALFLLIGGINTLNGVLLSFLYSMLMQPNLAYVAGYVSSLIIAYFLNTIFTFKVRPQFSKFIKFAVSYIPNFIIQNVIVVVFYNWLNLNRLLVYAFAALIGVPVTFLILKLYAFRSSK